MFSYNYQTMKLMNCVNLKFFIFSLIILSHIDAEIPSFDHNDFINGFIKSMQEGSFKPLENQFLNEDAYLTVPQIILKYEYPMEVHKVETSDGYILEMHRIPRAGGIPVYLQHGILDSSAGWILLGAKHSLAFILYDKGYDVWMGNTRGNKYSKQHVKLDVKSQKFWDFSFHENGVYDLPAMIDFIIKTTGHPKIHYIGHSQGTTAFFVMCSQSRTNCDKIILMSALSPVAYLEHVKSPLINALAIFTDPLEKLFKILGIKEILPSNKLLKMAGQIMCQKKSVIKKLCTNILFLVCGYDSEQLEESHVNVLLNHFPAGASSKQIVHYGQLRRSKQFRFYDYGVIRNLIKYYSLSPPKYDLSNVKVPVAIYYSKNDWLADIKDVNQLLKQLPNIIHTYNVPFTKFNHLDFIFAKDVKSLLYEEVLRTMEKAEKEFPIHKKR